MKEPLILFENFSFKYRAQAEPTLCSINLAIYPGEKVLIAGPSGCGKSTLAHCINGLIPFNYAGEISGRLCVNKKETSDQSVFDLSKVIGTVLQDTDGQFVGLSVAEDIAFSLENDCVPQADMLTRVLAAAEQVGIENELDASPFELSGGQKQRVSMAGVLVDEVQALLFDEPLANLDPATGKQAVELIDKVMHETDTTVIIIEHRLEDVLHCSVDRIILMSEGRIVADLPPDELLSCGLLLNNGIREPLYVTALKYAGIAVTPRHHPGLPENLTLDEDDVESVRRWFSEISLSDPLPRGDELLNVKELRFSYTSSEESVLKGINFCIQSGEMIAVVGANGAGKSTLAKLICGFERPTGGLITWQKEDLSTKSIAERASKIGYVMQNPNQMLSKPLLFDEVAIGLRSRGVNERETAERVEETLKICGLYPFRSWPISALSYGQKKRVTIAAVLVMTPELIILDEPTAGQDFRHYTEIMEFLRSLNQKGVTVMMITHDMHLMLEYAPRALVFFGGRLVADCSPASLLCNADLIKTASLKETGLFMLARRCGIYDGAAFTQRFVDYDRRVRNDGWL